MVSHSYTGINVTEPVEIPEQETVLHRTTLHWAILFGPGLLFIMGGMSLRAKPVPALIMIGLAIMWGIFSLYNLRRSEFVLTSSRLTIKAGFIFKRFYEIPYDKLGGADFFQPALGNLLNFGKIYILRKDGHAIIFRLVAKPEDFANRLKQEIIRHNQQPDAS